MTTLSNIKLYVAPPATAEIGAAYTRLVLGLAQYLPTLLHSYLGPAEWRDTGQTQPSSLEGLRQHAIAVATAAQKSDLPRNRQERILRNVRALLWLIRAQEGEQIMFSEQVRLLLDAQPESAGQEIFQTAHETLAEILPGSAPLNERWQAWQQRYTIPATEARSLLADGLVNLQRQVGQTVEPGQAVALNETASPHHRPGRPALSGQTPLRVDRLYHLAGRYYAEQLMHTAMTRRYSAGQVECAAILNLGPDQVVTRGLPPVLLSQLDLYHRAIPALLARANLPAVPPDQLQALHLAEDALQWAVANAALLLHSEGLRPRIVRRYLVSNGLLSPDQANNWLETLADPVAAAHIFAPLIGGPLLQAWLAGAQERTLASLLADPPVPSTMLFEVRFND